MESLLTQPFIFEMTELEKLDYEIDEKLRINEETEKLEKGYSNWLNIFFIPLIYELEKKGDTVNISWLFKENEIMNDASILNRETFCSFYLCDYDMYRNELLRYI
jgi:hypothetical protein